MNRKQRREGMRAMGQLPSPDGGTEPPPSPAPEFSEPVVQQCYNDLATTPLAVAWGHPDARVAVQQFQPPPLFFLPLPCDMRVEDVGCTAHFHPAWSFGHDLDSMVKVVMTAHARTRTLTVCNLARIVGQLQEWWSGTLPFTAIRIDSPMYRAMTKTLGPDAWRYTHRVQARWLTEFADTRNDMLQHICHTVPLKAVFRPNANKNEPPVWPWLELEEHLLEIAALGDDHPRPFVTRAIAFALRSAFVASRSRV